MPPRVVLAILALGLALVPWPGGGAPRATIAIAHAVNAESGSQRPHAPSTRSATTAPVVVPDDPWWSLEWGLARIGMGVLWGDTTGSPSTVIAVVDTGVSSSAPDLAGALLPGHDVVDGSGDTSDTVGHGTLVAEVAAGRGDNGVDGAGVCWRCSVLPVKVAPNGSATAAQLADGIRWAADHGANVINVSLVLTAADPGVGQAVQYAQDRGAVVVAAAGNDGGASPTYPAAYPGVIGVVATDPADDPYPWSTHGPWAAAAAPGCATVADLSGSAVEFCGSSAAAPYVSGLVGLLVSAGVRTPAGIRAALARSAFPLPASTAAGGRVDAATLASTLPR